MSSHLPSAEPSDQPPDQHRPERRRADTPAPPRHQWELVTFALVGLGVAVLGKELLVILLDRGVAPLPANAVQVLLTLQLSFLLSLSITWRHRVNGSGVSRWSRWRRFHVSRGAGVALNVVGFPLLAPRVGVAAAYWGLFVVCGVLNYLSDRHWSFAAAGARRATTVVVRLVVFATLVVALAEVDLDAVIVVVSLVMLVVMGTTLVFQLHRWWVPEHTDPARYGEPGPARLPGAVLVPLRHEEAVARRTLERLATLDHPDYLVIPVVDLDDDPGTAEIAHAVAAEHPGRVLVCAYPPDAGVHNKPIALNAAVEMLDERGLQVQWVGVADAEDLFHPQLLRMVDHRFRTTDAGIVQCGVQLMNFSSRTDPAHGVTHSLAGRARRWWRANTSAWWRAANVLEYYKWFQSRLTLQARLGVMPLGGNTVFFRRHVLDDLHRRHGTYWDPTCLTEDCKIGISASVIGHRTDVVYVAELVTREETPPTLRALLHQRVRWMQGFIQVFLAGEWRLLPTRRQRALSVYVLGFQFFQAGSLLLAPFALVVALAHGAADAVALFSFLPLGLGVLCVALDVLLLHHFSRTFGPPARLRDHLGVVLGAYPYQLVLSVAAVWAALRVVAGRDNWVKTEHTGAHLGAEHPVASASAEPGTGR